MYEKYKPLVTLTAKGSALDLDNFDVKTEVREKAAIYWEEKASKNKNKDKVVNVEDEFEDEEEKSKRLSACRKSYSWNDADRVWNVRAADRAKRGKRTE